MACITAICLKLTELVYTSIMPAGVCFLDAIDIRISHMSLHNTDGRGVHGAVSNRSHRAHRAAGKHAAKGGNSRAVSSVGLHAVPSVYE